MTARILMLTAVAALAFSAVASAAEKEKQAEIPFANNGGINDWRAESDRVLFVQGRDRQWYKAALLSDCIGLQFAEKIAFDNDANGSFTRFSSIKVGGRSCAVTSLEKSDKPPSKKDKEAAKP